MSRECRASEAHRDTGRARASTERDSMDRQTDRENAHGHIRGDPLHTRFSLDTPPPPPRCRLIICVRFDTLTLALPRAAQGLLSSLIPYLPTYGRSRGHQSGRLADRHTTTRRQTPPAPDCRTRTQAAASMIASRCNPLPMPEVPRSAAQSSLRITHPSLRPYLGPVGVYGGGITGGARRRGRPAFLLRVAEV